MPKSRGVEHHQAYEVIDERNEAEFLVYSLGRFAVQLIHPQCGFELPDLRFHGPACAIQLPDFLRWLTLGANKVVTTVTGRARNPGGST